MDKNTVYVALQGTNACGCSNHRMCLEHYLAAQRLLGDPREGVTIMAGIPTNILEKNKN